MVCSLIYNPSFSLSLFQIFGLWLISIVRELQINIPRETERFSDLANEIMSRRCKL